MQATATSAPGVAKKASDGEQTIGYALEDYATETASSTIQLFITHGASARILTFAPVTWGRNP